MAHCDIFIGYDRASAATPALTLYRYLCHYFRREQIYVDRKTVQSDNLNSNELSDEYLRQSKVVLYLVTGDWTDTSEAPIQQVDKSRSMHFLQELSRDRGKTLIPILYGGAGIPLELTVYNSFALRGPEDPLQIAELARLIAKITTEPTLPTDNSSCSFSIEKDSPARRAEPIGEVMSGTMIPATPDDLSLEIHIGEPSVPRSVSNDSGSEDVDNISSLQREAEALWLAGEFTKARLVQERVLDACSRALGKEHPERLAALCNLAEMFWALGNLAEAKALYQQVLDVQRDALGDRHPATTAAAWNVFLTLTGMSDHAAAGHVIQQYLSWLQDSAPEILSPEQQRIQDIIRQFFS